MLPVTLLRITLILTFLLGLSAAVAGLLALHAHRRRAATQPSAGTSDDEH